MCSNHLSPWEGQNAPRDYSYAAREIAHAFVLLSRGSSYQEAGISARRLGRRLRHSVYKLNGRKRKVDNDGQVAANWVDVLAETIGDAYLPQAWPKRIAVDSTGFQVSSMALKRQGMRFNLLVAHGYPEDGSSANQVWLILPSPQKTILAWRYFFGRLPGAPEVIVSDDDNAIAAAIKRSFPTAEHRLCEHHLMENLRHHVHEDYLQDPQHPVLINLPYALSSQGGWQRFGDAVRHEYTYGSTRRINQTLRWINVMADRVWPQLLTRHEEGPNSTGVVETTETKLSDYLRRRYYLMTNLERCRKLMLLMQAQLVGHANELEWAELIRKELELRAGRPINQRPHDDPLGHWSLLS